MKINKKDMNICRKALYLMSQLVRISYLIFVKSGLPWAIRYQAH